MDRTAINQNFDAHVKGAEVEATWEPLPGLRFNASGGYEDARAANGEKAIDLMDRTAGNHGLDGRAPVPDAGLELHLAGLCRGGVVISQGNFWLAANAIWRQHASSPAAMPMLQGFDPVTAAFLSSSSGRNVHIHRAPTSIPDDYPGFNPINRTATTMAPGLFPMAVKVSTRI